MRYLKQSMSLGILVLIVMGALPAALAASWSSVRALNQSGGDAESAQLVQTQDGRLIAVWSESTGSYARLVLRESANGGDSWGTERLLNLAGNGDQINPQMAVSGLVLHLAWVERAAGRFARVRYAQSLDHGVTWSIPIALSAPRLASGSLALTSQGTHVYIAWRDRALGSNRLLFKQSNDQGASWGTELELLPQNRATIDHLQLVASSTHIVVILEAWNQVIPEISMLTRTLAGTQWALPIEISNRDRIASRESSSVFSNGILYTIWNDLTTGGQLVFNSYNPQIQGSQRRTIYMGSNLRQPVMAGKGDNLWITGMGTQSSKPILFELNSSNRGSSWSSASAAITGPLQYESVQFRQTLLTEAKKIILFGAYGASPASGLKLVQSPPPVLTATHMWQVYP